MSVELGRKTVRINQVVEENSTQTVIENDIIVPDIKPDIADILVMDGDIRINNTECMQGRILVKGTIDFKILYTSDEENSNIKSISSQQDFSYSIDLQNVEPEMDCKTKCNIEHIDHNILNSRKLSIKTIIKIDVKIYKKTDIGIANEIMNVDNVQILNDNINVNCYLGETNMDFTLNESMELPAGNPPVKEILRTDCCIRETNYNIVNDNIEAEGIVNILTLYTGDDEEENIQLVENEIPFVQSVGFEGINENSNCEIDYEILENNIKAGEDNDGELRQINVEVCINIKVSGYQKQDIATVKDAYSPDNMLSFEKTPFKTEELLSEENNQINLKEIIAINDNYPEIDQVFNILSNPVLSNYSINDNTVEFEGIVSNNVLYLADSDEKPVNCYRQEIPFRKSIRIDNMTENSSCQISLDIQHSSYSIISSTEIELRLVIDYNIKVITQTEIDLIEDVQENPVDENILLSQPSIVIYFIQSNDTLWDIAKRYYTTVDAIKDMNNLQTDEITTGSQIFIPRRVS